jgi:hypothetical protein
VPHNSGPNARPPQAATLGINKPENKKKFGPSLFRFFQNAKTPLTRVKPSESYMVTKIKNGGVVMPAFGDILTTDQIKTIVTFIRSRH